MAILDFLQTDPEDIVAQLFQQSQLTGQGIGGNLVGGGPSRVGQAIGPVEQRIQQPQSLPVSTPPLQAPQAPVGPPGGDSPFGALSTNQLSQALLGAGGALIEAGAPGLKRDKLSTGQALVRALQGFATGLERGRAKDERISDRDTAKKKLLSDLDRAEQANDRDWIRVTLSISNSALDAQTKKSQLELAAKKFQREVTQDDIDLVFRTETADLAEQTFSQKVIADTERNARAVERNALSQTRFQQELTEFGVSQEQFADTFGLRKEIWEAQHPMDLTRLDLAKTADQRKELMFQHRKDMDELRAEEINARVKKLGAEYDKLGKEAQSLTSMEAARAQMLVTAEETLAIIPTLLFDQGHTAADPDFNNTNILNASIKLPGLSTRGLPFTDGRALWSLYGQGIQAILRGETGAQINIQEFPAVMERYMPQPGDPSLTKQIKWEMFKKTIRGTLTLMMPNRDPTVGELAEAKTEGRVSLRDGLVYEFNQEAYQLEFNRTAKEIQDKLRLQGNTADVLDDFIGRP